MQVHRLWHKTVQPCTIVSQRMQCKWMCYTLGHTACSATRSGKPSASYSNTSRMILHHRKHTVYVTQSFLSVCLSVCLPAHLPACLSVCVSACLPVCVCVSMCVHICLSDCVCVWACIGWCIYESVILNFLDHIHFLEALCFLLLEMCFMFVLSGYEYHGLNEW